MILTNHVDQSVLLSSEEPEPSATALVGVSILMWGRCLLPEWSAYAAVVLTADPDLASPYAIGSNGAVASITQISIVGDGAMATVCAFVLDANGYRVTMWGHNADHVEEMIQSGQNARFLKDYPFPSTLRLTSRDDKIFDDVELVISAVPCQHMRSVWSRLNPHVPADVPIVSVAKGIENETLLRPTQILTDVLGPKPTAALSGPSIAPELARCLPATVVAASKDEELAGVVQSIFTTDWFRIYTNRDVLGVELAGAGKNVIAIAAGIIDGLQAGDNAKAALLSRGLVELMRLGLAMGAQRETFFGLAGLGDLVTTCISPVGRNRTVGEQIGKGRKLEEVLSKMESVAEGVATTRSICALADKFDVQMPITRAVWSVLFEDKDVIEAIGQLMQRPPKQERL